MSGFLISDFLIFHAFKTTSLQLLGHLSSTKIISTFRFPLSKGHDLIKSRITTPLLYIGIITETSAFSVDRNQFGVETSWVAVA
jgi:hypothetical protein